MTRSIRIKLYTEQPKWLVFTTGGFAAEIYVRNSKIMVASGDTNLKAELEAEIGRLVANEQVKGVSVTRTRVAGRRDTLTHFVEPKITSDPAFLGYLWENPFWHRREIAGHTIIKERSQLIIEPIERSAG